MGSQKIADHVEQWDSGWSDMIPGPRFLEIQDGLIAAIDANAAGTNVQYAWRRIRESLPACNIYVSPHQILIRPFIAPTKTFRPFEEARQRIYMSATLGEGGELERTTGRRLIYRLPSPKGYDRQTMGRRYFMFPCRSLSEDDAAALAVDLIAVAKHGRALVLAPTNELADDFKDAMQAKLGFTVSPG